MRHKQLQEYMPPSLAGRGWGRVRWGRVRGWVFLLLCLSLTSCEFFDLDEEGVVTPAEMRLAQDTIYVMRGDTFSITPLFDPDTVNIEDLFFLPTRPEVVEARGGQKMEAVGEGWTTVYVTSVSARLMDSCMVYVSAPWTPEYRVWPYETVFYANVTLKGQPLGEDMAVAAFVGNECRAIGQLKSAYGISYMQLRVGAESLYDYDPSLLADDEEMGDVDSEEEATDYRPQIRFRLYDYRNLRLYTTPAYGIFDGEVHGTLSDLYEIPF